MSGDRGNELADIRARWSAAHDRAAHDYTDAGCRVLAEHAFNDVPALLSRLDTLEATAARLVKDEQDARWRFDLADQLRAAEAQVEALTEALREIAATDPSDCDRQDVAQTYERIAREALSRVSRSEPAPPTCAACLGDARGARSARLRKGAVRMMPAPPVPEEQQ